MPKLESDSESGSDLEDDGSPGPVHHSIENHLNGGVRKPVETLPQRRGGRRKAETEVDKEEEVKQDDDDVEEDVEGKGNEVDDEEDEGEGDGEYNVEAIRGHEWIKGKLLYNTKWLGYDEEENTYEPEENLLPGAQQILKEYHTSIGGPPQKPNSTNSRKRKSTTFRENLPSATALKSESQLSDGPAASNTKKARKPQQRDPEDGTAISESSYRPRGNNWTSEVQKIDTIIRDPENEKLYAYIHWTNGERTKVGMDKVYKHCPVPMLHFYEEHLKFT